MKKQKQFFQPPDLYVRQSAQMGVVMNKIKEFIKEEDGIAIVEIILILVLLIGLVILFRESITNIVSDIIATISDNVNSFNE